MPLFGAHMSIAGGYYKAVEAAAVHGMDTCQLFTKNNNQWRAKEITEDEVKVFRETLKKTKIKYPTAHDCYLINLASPDQELFRKSVEAFVIEMQRAEMLNLSYLVMHPGAHMGEGEEDGLRRVADALDEAHQRCPNFRVKVLLETTAGQGTALGYRFEHLARILELVKEPDRLGVCLDTCHVFAAGYPLWPEKAYRKTMSEFNQLIGLNRLLCFHVNDSKKELGSRVDRHEHIGRGCLGLEAFRLLVNDRRFRNRPMILETPKEEGDNRDMDRVNIATLRGLLRSS